MPESQRVWIRKATRGLAWGAAVLAAVLVLGVVLLLLPPVRARILSEVVRRAEARLPGTLLVDHAEWPSPGKVDLRGLRWTEEGDTLLDVRGLAVEVDLPALLRRDLHGRQITLDVLRMDLPALRARFPAGRANLARPERAGSGRRFPREGSIPGFPSVALDSLLVRVEVLRLSPEMTLRGTELSGGVDVRRGRRPDLRLERLAVSGPGDRWGFGETSLEIDLATWKCRGRGSGHLAPGWPVTFELSSDSENTFHLVLSRREEGRAADEPGLDLTGRLDREGPRLLGLTFDAVLVTPGTEELARIPQLTSALADLPPLAGVRVAFEGSLGLKPSPRARLSADLAANAWLDGGLIRMAYDSGTVTVDSLSVRAADLDLAGTAQVSRDSLDARGDLKVRGTRWLRILRPEAALPEEIRADLTVAAAGAARSPTLQAALKASGRMGSLDLKRLSLEADVPGDKKRPANMQISAEAEDLILRGSAEVDRDGDIVARLAPFVLQDAKAPAGRPVGSPGVPGRLHLRRKEKSLEFEDVSLIGALGILSLNGNLSREGNGAFRLRWSWPEPPVVLGRAMGLEGARADSLAARWGREDSLGVEISGLLTSETGSRKLGCRGSLALPGPRTLAVLLPEGASVDDLGPVRGTFDVSALSQPEHSEFALAVDLGRTAWIDRARAVLHKTDGRVEIDTVDVALEGVELGAAGGLEDGRWDLETRLDVSDARILGRFVGAIGEDADLHLGASAHLLGTKEAPEVEASADLRFARGGYRVPELHGRLQMARGQFELEMDAPKGLVAEPVHLDSLRAVYRGVSEGRSFPPGQLVVSAHGPEIGIFQSARVDRNHGWDVAADSLALQLGSRYLASTGPFHIRLSPGNLLGIDEMTLEGSLGSVRASGYAGPDSAEMTAEVALRLPEDPPIAAIPKDLWPRGLDVRLQATGPGDLSARASVSGLSLAGHTEIGASLGLSTGAGGIAADLEVLDGRASILKSAARLPASIAVYPPRGSLRKGPVFLDAEFSGFPVPLGAGVKAGAPGRVAAADGRVSVRGTMTDPIAYADLGLSFPGWPKMSRYVLSVEAETQGAAGPGPELQSLRKPGSMLEAQKGLPTGSELRAALSLAREGRALLRGEGRYPLIWSLIPFGIEPGGDRNMVLKVNSEDLPLSEFDPLLPPNAGLGGTCRVDFTASGPAADPALEGRFRANQLRVSLADGTRATADGDLSLGGTLRRPSVKGNIEIGSGVIRIPETPKNLLPAEGTAVLWEAQRGPYVAEDTSGTAPSESGRGAPGKPAVAMDLDVGVAIPSGLWIRGQGLDVELAGDLRVVQKGLYPTVTGNLQAVQGRFVFLGRTFLVDRGEAVFYGDDEINPSLDLALSTQVETFRIQILLQGTVGKPQLQLSSDPELAEGDIMSMLLFGRRLEELDSDQVNLVERRGADIAAAFGTGQLEARLARQLGVDMVSIQKSSGENGRRSVVFGKYVSRRVLLTYEQTLQEWGSFFVNLEYSLTRRLKVETLMGRQSQSGIEINWSDEY